ncbi:dsRNA binding protein [Pyrrhoderma noxium]|uniref:DsRNA binding protein n=1 Tax=Pyrrhoderma noxium TaxID=2282107 RepID=A0A286UNQ8_9AGAM|nr:dsRNA binding protein [Pyrrhoderma noxium]
MENGGTVELNNFLQSKHKATDLSWLESVNGPDHEPEWTCTCLIKGRSYGTGQGSNKKDARNEASKSALRRLRDEERT